MVQLGNANSLIFPNGVYAQLIKILLCRVRVLVLFFYGVRLKLFYCCSYLVTGQLVTQQQLLSQKINWKHFTPKKLVSSQVTIWKCIESKKEHSNKLVKIQADILSGP